MRVWKGLLRRLAPQVSMISPWREAILGSRSLCRGMASTVENLRVDGFQERRFLKQYKYTWPPIKRRPNRPKANNIKERREKKVRGYLNWRKEVADDLQAYTPPSLIEAMAEKNATGYDAKLSERFRLYSIAGTGVNDGESVDGTFSNVFTEHKDEDLGVDPASPKMMFAVIVIGSRQFRVVPGDIIYSEKIDVRVNETVRLRKVLMCASRNWSVFGRPLVHSASVTAVVEEQGKTKHIQRMFWGRSTRVRRRYGHRQELTRLRVEGIDFTPPTEGSLEPLRLTPAIMAPPRSKSTLTVTGDDR